MPNLTVEGDALDHGACTYLSPSFLNTEVSMRMDSEKGVYDSDTSQFMQEGCGDPVPRAGSCASRQVDSFSFFFKKTTLFFYFEILTFG